MRSDAKLVDLGADVRILRRSRTGKIILDLQRDKERKGAAYKSLTEEVHGEGVVVRAPTLKVKNLDEVTEADEVVTALRQQCELQVAAAAVRLRKGPAGIQVALDQLPVADWRFVSSVWNQDTSHGTAASCVGDATPKALRYKAPRVHPFV